MSRSAIYLGIGITLILVVVLAWVVVRSSRTVFTTLAEHPSHRGILIPTGLTLLSLLLCAVSPSFLVLTTLCWAMAWFVAKMQQLTDDRLMQRPWSFRGDLMAPGTWWSNN